MYRTRKHYSYYKNQTKKEGTKCPFCYLLNEETIVLEDKHFYILPPKYPYNYWENCKVLEHLLIIPKIHSKSLADLPDSAAQDIYKAIIKYESKGYDIFTRASGNSTRTVKDHLHIHLIKTDSKIANINISIEKPYFLFVK